jgi:hypothetical protein
MTKIRAPSVRDALIRQLGCARKLLESRTSPDTVLHQVRKHLKIARSLLRLLRSATGSAAYHRANHSLRDVGRQFREFRDAQVALSTLAAIRHRAPQFAPALRRLRRPLVTRLQLCRRQAAADHRATAAVAMLGQIIVEIRRWKLPPRGARGIRQGLRHTLRTARRSFQQARAGSTGAALHECRKQTKYFRQQLKFLQPHHCARQIKRADELADRLGEYRDLTLLRSQAIEARGQSSAFAALPALLRRIDARRQKLRRKSIKLGGQLYRK